MKFYDVYLMFVKVVYGIKRGSVLWWWCVCGMIKFVDMGVFMLFVIDKKLEFINGSMYYVSIIMYC